MQHQQYRVPAYADTSHFRAPYKNVWSMGATTDSPPPPPPGGGLEPGEDIVDESLVGAMFNVDEEGTHRFKQQVANTIVAYMLTHKIIQLPGAVPERVVVEPYTPEEIAAMETPEGQAVFAPLQASKWIADKVKEGKVVFAPAYILAPTGSVEKQLAAIPAGEKAKVKEAASTPYVGILAAPAGGFFANISMANVGIAVGALAVIGGGYWMYRRSQNGGRTPVMY